MNNLLLSSKDSTLSWFAKQRRREFDYSRFSWPLVSKWGSDSARSLTATMAVA